MNRNFHHRSLLNYKVCSFVHQLIEVIAFFCRRD